MRERHLRNPRLLHAGPFLEFLFVSAQFIEENCTLNAKLSVIVDSTLSDKILRLYEYVEILILMRAN
jgi:hypothetical protein